MNTQAQLVIPFGLPQSNESSGTKQLQVNKQQTKYSDPSE
jgi:hypothetical protein